MEFIKTPTKGMRDILPKAMELREYVLMVMKDVYRTFGFEIIQTPIVEHIENMSTNQGGENEKLIFKIMKRGEKLQLEDHNFDSLVDSALRYDLTVPLTRFYANHSKDLATPFRAFQMGNVYRAERSQKGRFREFMQCDLDILGEKSNLAEIELLTAVITFLKKLDFKNFTIRLNDRRILEKMIIKANFPIEKMQQIFIVIDKLDKIGLEGVQNDLIALGLAKNDVMNYVNYFQGSLSLKDCGTLCGVEESVLANLEEIMDVVKNLTDAHLVFDPTLVRGMGYYTGPIFEISVDGFASSIGGGGRYDKMISKYANQEVAACGFSIGFERLLLLLEERHFQVPRSFHKISYVISSDTSFLPLFKEVKEQREKGNIVKVLYRNKNVKYQKECLEKDGYEIIEW